MTIVDPSLRFWIRYAEQRGALSEDAGPGSAILVLPETLQRALDLPEELAVTADPDAAREEGALLLVPGQPVLDRAAEVVLTEGDVGVSWLAWPASSRPSCGVLVDAARDQIPVDHGRIDAAGKPAPVLYPLLRVGALLTYTVSLDLRFQEREEVWVDARNGDAVDERVRRLAASATTELAPSSTRRQQPADLVSAVGAAHSLLEVRAADRLGQFARHAGEARRRQLEAAEAYYHDALASVERRRTTATAERRALLDAQEEATRVERSRRLAEIEATFAPRHEVRPFRAHLVLVPALQVPVDVRRGGRTYPFTLAWLLGAAMFVPPRCPGCGSDQVLVAGRQGLGCRACLPAPSPAPDARARVAGLGEVKGNADSAVSVSVPEPRAGPNRAEQASRSAPPSRRSRPPASRTVGPGPRVSAATPLGGYEKVGTRLATDLWGAALRGERWPRKGKGMAPESPFAAAVRLFGVHGPVRAVGLESGRSIVDLTSVTLNPPGSLLCTTGRIWTGSEVFPFTLRWALDGTKPVVSEVLPFVGAGNDQLPPLGRLHPDAAALLTQGAPTPRFALDPVAAATWALAVAPLGLPVVLRCLAAWWRVCDEVDQERHPSPVLAAALVRVVAARAGARRAALPIGLGVDAAAVASAARFLQSRLHLTSTRPW
ncbi:MAG: hypothetical protein ACR2HV_11335 [Acidimicrobiales bacterium]